MDDSDDRRSELATPEKPEQHAQRPGGPIPPFPTPPPQPEPVPSDKPAEAEQKAMRQRLAKDPEQLAALLVQDLDGDLTSSNLAERVLRIASARQLALSANSVASRVMKWLLSQVKDEELTLAGHTCRAEVVKEAASIIFNKVGAAAGTSQLRQPSGAGGSSSSSSESSSSSSSSGKRRRHADGRSGPETPKRETTSCADSPSTSSTSSGSTSDRTDTAAGSDLSGEEDVDDENHGLPSLRALSPASPGTPAPPRRLVKPPDVNWSGVPSQGTDGFNTAAVTALRQARVACRAPAVPVKKTSHASQPPQVKQEAHETSRPLAAPAKKKTLHACPPLQPHQEVPIALLQPSSPVQRLLIDHPTGSGKTREVVGVLQNFFKDPRAKVPIFPKEAVCQNFYAELLRWPSSYRDYFCLLRPEIAAQVSRSKDWRRVRSSLWDLQRIVQKDLKEICRELRDVLEMKGCFYMGRMRVKWLTAFREKFPNEALPAAPLRALRYTSAGGRHTILQADGLPRSALFKIGFNRNDPNVYTNKIVVMDEVHNLVRTQTAYGEQLENLRRLLLAANGAVLAGFTGTPILSQADEGQQLLRVIKGASAPAGHEGYMSSFPFRPRMLFPRAFPHGVPDAVLTPKLRRQFVKKSTLHGESLYRYDKKRAAKVERQFLQRYCNMSVHFGSMHSGKLGSKARVLDNFAACAPKLYQIVEDIAGDPSKAVVLIARSTGMDALLDRLRSVADKGSGVSKFGIATMDELADFNAASNLRGQRYRVLVADVTQCGEGVSFFGVRRVLLADVPVSHSGFVQAVGRCIRMYGHKGLPEEDWTVTLTLYIASLPAWMQSTLAAWVYRILRHHQDPAVAERKAKSILRQLLKADVTTLEQLKQLCDASFPTRSKASKEKLTAADGARLCESLGLSRLARTLTAQSNQTGFAAGGNGRRPGSTLARSGRSRSFKAPGKQKGKGKRGVRQHPFVKAVQRLLLAENAEQLCQDLHLSSRTADEDALRELAAQSQTLSTALADLRSLAVDKDLFASMEFDALGARGDDSDGESSQASFAVSSGGSSDDADDLPAPFVLPADWQVTKVKRGKSFVRHFVDPAGRRYTSVAQARAAVENMRRSSNLSARLCSQFQDRFAKRKVESPVDETEVKGDLKTESLVDVKTEVKPEVKTEDISPSKKRLRLFLLSWE
mmetsp:Transcript_56241/g.126527  ORF Transcript_56241/g.126527 Transcript_56241/m.126527 type:complete len:1181 (-) Transcript_56241:2-3544(-)